MITKCHEHSKVGNRLTFSPPHHITSSDTIVMFEFECKSVINQEPYQGRIAIALEVTNEKISGFREYFGDVDW